MARRWLRYNLKIFQFCLSLYSFNYFLQTDFIREKKKRNSAMVDNETTCSPADVNTNISGLSHLHSQLFISVVYPQYTGSTYKALNPKNT